MYPSNMNGHVYVSTANASNKDTGTLPTEHHYLICYMLITTD